MGANATCVVHEQLEGCVSVPSRWLVLTYLETRLETHDIAFPVKGHGDNIVVRGILISTAEVRTPGIRGRLERLRILNGGSFIFVILLLNGVGSMAALLEVQMEFVITNQEPRVTS